jgi:amino acid adenylation domain-containing protein
MSDPKERVGADLSPAERRELLAKLLRSRASRARLSFAQERLWFLHQLVPGMPVYNVPAAVRLSGPLDVEALERSLAEIVTRHAVLRTRFEHFKGRPIPRVSDDVDLVLEREDLSDLEDGERAALARANEEVRRTFDLERGPLFRARLLRLADDDHLLVLTLHHIVAEGWSVALLFAELERLYAAFRKGGASPLEPLPIQYSDFAQWQRERQSSETVARELDYWRQQLAGDLPVLELPTDRPRQPVQTFAGAWRARRLDAELVHRLGELAASRGATLYMLLLAAFQVLLHRYSGLDDILVGSPIAARNRAEAERLIGVFLNTLVMRADLSDDPCFTDLLDRVRETAVGAFSNQEVPFEHIVERLQPDRHTSHTPIFQVMFAMQNTPRQALALDGLEPGRVLDPSLVHNGTTKLDLAMFVEESPEGFEAACEYATDLFDGETMERLLGHYETLLAAIVADPSTRVSRLRLVEDRERHTLLVEWNDGAADYPPTAAHELFEARVREHPDNLAVVCGEAHLSYAELDRQANRLARFLRHHGVREESRVALMVAPSTDAVLGMLATAKAGGCYLPLDPAYPHQRLAYLLEDAGVDILLTQELLLERLPQTAARVVCLDRDRAEWTGSSDEPLGIATSPDQLAYVIYTSGSTGKPKGVEVPHRGLSNLSAWHRSTYDLAPEDRGTQLAGLGFDASVWEIWPYLTAGASLYVVEEETRISPDAVIDFLADNRITVAFVPTPLTELILEREAPEEMALRDLLTGGSQLHRYCARRAPYRLVNHYGPTENSVVTTSDVVEVRDGGQGLPPIGRPIANHRVYILDRHLEPVPIGVPGEIHVAGPGVARCYTGRAAQTAERFLPDPFAGDGGRMYATGDIGRHLADGRIEFLGRQDGQVKVRGYRIELGEIESNLRGHPAVGEAVVLARHGDGRHAYLAAYVTTHGGEALPADELRGFLRQSLPDYMIPAVYMNLAEMPLTPNGKIDREALPAPTSARAAEQPFDAPRNQLELAIATIWQEALAVDRVSRDDNFFDLGGHSLLLVMVHGKLRERFGTDITIVDMFRHPTVAALARYLAEQGLGELESEPIDQSQLGLERRVARLWQELLPTDEIGLNDNFFELGGHSMMLVEVHARLKEIVDYDISVVDLFRYPTISSLVNFLESRRPAGQEA